MEGCIVSCCIVLYCIEGREGGKMMFGKGRMNGLDWSSYGSDIRTGLGRAR